MPERERHDGALPLLTGFGWRDSVDAEAEQAWSGEWQDVDEDTDD